MYFPLKIEISMRPFSVSLSVILQEFFKILPMTMTKESEFFKHIYEVFEFLIVEQQNRKIFGVI